MEITTREKIISLDTVIDMLEQLIKLIHEIKEEQEQLREEITKGE